MLQELNCFQLKLLVSLQCKIRAYLVEWLQNLDMRIHFFSKSFWLIWLLSKTLWVHKHYAINNGHPSFNLFSFNANVKWLPGSTSHYGYSRQPVLLLHIIFLFVVIFSFKCKGTLKVVVVVVIQNWAWWFLFLLHFSITL